MTASNFSLDAILAAEEQARKEWEANTYHGPYTIAQLRTVFERSVAPGDHWKAPIRTICAEEDRDLTVAAIQYFVGGPTTVTPTTFNRGGEQVTLLVLTNGGYYQNIGA